MKIPKEIKVYGSTNSGVVPSESIEMITFFNKLRREHPEYAAIAFHCRNEGKRTLQQTQKQKAEGLTVGVPDIIIPCNPPFVCELKSRSPRATITQEQIDYLLQAQELGAFVCVALGYEGAMEAFKKCVHL